MGGRSVSSKTPLVHGARDGAQAETAPSSPAAYLAPVSGTSIPSLFISFSRSDTEESAASIVRRNNSFSSCRTSMGFFSACRRHDGSLAGVGPATRERCWVWRWPSAGARDPREERVTECILSFAGLDLQTQFTKPTQGKANPIAAGSWTHTLECHNTNINYPEQCTSRLITSSARISSKHSTAKERKPWNGPAGSYQVETDR
mmetsp:Transcript_20553/g.57020  ORF Transcript_20553/g.57020 Transcript_20553/m.57020 type:complete len:203 (+) Transcript_20553:2615-3223(+)